MVENMIRGTTAKDPKPSPERVQQLATRVLMGDIVLPEFQRPFVWSRKQILDLLDSIYRNYPIGSLLVWESRQPLESKRTIADLEVEGRSEEYPVNYLLDGQQRLSTVCGVLYWKPGKPNSIWNVAFDLEDQRFLHLSTLEGRLAHQLPLRWLADPSTFYKQILPIEDQTLRDTADRLFNRFKDYQVPLVTLGDMSLADVGPVFERINSTGTKLTLFDLMRAATWSPEFDLGKTVDGIAQAIAPKGFGNVEQKTLLRALGAAGRTDFSAESIDALRTLASESLQSAAQVTTEAAKRAADFLATEIRAPRAEALPYTNQYAVLCEIFRLVPHPNSNQLAEIKRWFWGTTLSGYFAGWDNAQMAQDAASIRTWARGERDEIDIRMVLPTAQLWSAKTFRSNSAVSKMLGLLLAHRTPRDLLNGQALDIGKSLAWSNDKEYHHLFPKAFMKTAGRAGDANFVANVILLTSISNIRISDEAPSTYLARIIDEVGRSEVEQRLDSNLVPPTALDAALQDDYDKFLRERSEYLHAEVGKLAPLGLPARPSEEDSNQRDDTDDDTGI